MTKELYGVLGVDKSASQTEIKKGYRAKAKQYHPDKNPGDEQAESNFKDVAYAYEILSDDDKKDRYDRRGHAGLNPQQEQRQRYKNPFAEIIREQQEREEAERYNINVGISITLEDAYSGVTKKFNYNKQVKCTPCKGFGGSNPNKCNKCNGSGSLTTVIRTPVGMMQQILSCDACNGKGKTYDDFCGTCHGKGMSTLRTEVSIDIPASPTEIIIKRGGGNMIPNGTYGNLSIRVDILPHIKFKLTYNFGLVSDLKVPYEKLMLGGQIEFQTIDGGTVKLSVKKLSKIGDKLKLKGKGLKDSSLIQKFGSPRGDQYLILQVDIPNSITKEEEDLLKQIKKLKE